MTDWPYVSLKPTILPWEYHRYVIRPLQFMGYSQSYQNMPSWLLSHLQRDKANCWATNVGWHGAAVGRKPDGSPAVELPEETVKQLADHLEKLKELNWPAFLGIITCTNFHLYPEWMGRSYPEIFSLDQDGQKVLLDFESDAPPASNQYWPGMESAVLNASKAEFTRQVLTRFGTHPGIAAWFMDGESLHPNSPGHLGDYSSLAVEHFREWLRLRYDGEIAGLNHAWATDYDDFGDVIPPRPLSQPPTSHSEQFIHAAAPLEGDAVQISRDRPNLDWHRFRVWQVTEYVRFLEEIYRDNAPGALCLSWLHDVAYRRDELRCCGVSPHEYALLGDGLNADPITRSSDYHYTSLYFEVANSFDKVVVAKELSYYPRPIPYGEAKRMLWEVLGLGLWHSAWVEYYQKNQQALIDWSIYGTEAEDASRDFYRMLNEWNDDLTGMAPMKPEVRLYISDPTWLLKGWRSGWNQMHLLLQENQIDRLFLFDTQLETKRFWPKYIISVANDIVSQSSMKSLTKFVRQGGRLILLNIECRFDDDHASLTPDAIFRASGIPFKQSITTDEDCEEFVLENGRILWFNLNWADINANGQLNIVEKIIDWITSDNFKRPVAAINKSEIDKAIEVFNLSDGTNNAVILFNTGEDEKDINLYINDSQTHVHLRPYDGSFVYLPKQNIPDGLVEKIHQLSDYRDVFCQQGFEVELLSLFIEWARHGIDINRPDKALAALNRAQKLILLRLDHIEETGVSFFMETLDGTVPSICDVDARLVPLFDHRVSGKVLGKTLFIRTDRSTFPLVYDYQAKKYKKYQNRLWLRTSVFEVDGGYGYQEIELPM